MLEVCHVGRQVPAGTGWLVQDISFQLHAGERLVLAGPSGSGKSVLLRALARLDEIDAGEILWRGQPVADHMTPAYRSRVVYMHQRPAFLEGSVIANLEMPFQLRQHRDLHFDQDRVIPWLNLLGRDPAFLQRLTADLSGGERQIVAILRVMQLDPQVLLFDEPTSAADPQIAASIERLALSWAERDPERALIWVTHDAAQAKRIGQRELLLDKGRLI